MKKKKRRSEIVKVGIISHFLGGLWWLLWWFWWWWELWFRFIGFCDVF